MLSKRCSAKESCGRFAINAADTRVSLRIVDASDPELLPSLKHTNLVSRWRCDMPQLLLSSVRFWATESAEQVARATCMVWVAWSLQPAGDGLAFTILDMENADRGIADMLFFREGFTQSLVKDRKLQLLP